MLVGMVAWRNPTLAVVLAQRRHAHSRTRRQITGIKKRGTKKAQTLSGLGYGHQLLGVVDFPEGVNRQSEAQGIGGFVTSFLLHFD